MKTITKIIASAIALVGLVMLVGDLPEANIVHFAFVKIAGLAALYAGVKMWERYIPNEEV